VRSTSIERINKYDHVIVQATSFAAIPSVRIAKTLSSCTKRLPKNPVSLHQSYFFILPWKVLMNKCMCSVV